MIWSSDRLARLAAVAIVSGLAVSHLQAHGKWVTLDNCSLIPNASNDGDSFHVRAKRREYIFRLYFADAPETDPGLADRLEEQARYFGITVAQTLQLGERARNFTNQELSKPFTVLTCRSDALGRSKLERFYAFVKIDNKDLAEELVENGLARVHGASAAPAGLPLAEGEWAKLERLEAEAKREKVGGWGVNFGRMNVRSQREGGTLYDGFDAFFHSTSTTPAPATMATAPAPLPGRAPAIERPLRSSGTTMAAPVAAKLDVNSASAEELQNVPGIGPVLADRIIAARRFKSADDLKNVKGIGAKTYDKVRPFFN